MITGSLTVGDRIAPLENGRMDGATIAFGVDGGQYSGTVAGDQIEGVVKVGGIERRWTATR